MQEGRVKPFRHVHPAKPSNYSDTAKTLKTKQDKTKQDKTKHSKAKLLPEGNKQVIWLLIINRCRILPWRFDQMSELTRISFEVAYLVLVNKAC